MPQTFYVPETAHEFEVYIVTKNGVEQQAYILERRPEEVYVHYVNTDKRLDEWVSEDSVRPAGEHEVAQTDDMSSSSIAQSHNESATANDRSGSAARKRKRVSLEPETLTPRKKSLELVSGVGLGLDGGAVEGSEGAVTGGATTTITEEEYDIEHHKQITAKRNFDKVNFGRWQIKTWYFSPYPLIESEADDHVSTPTSHGTSSTLPPRIPGVARTTYRSHGRTSDLLAGGLGRNHGAGEKSMLWVCDKCFKYMAEGVSWELHVKKCTVRHPPGRKVYQRGAHIIWEVDGAKEKLYCQNLSLFGKLFIDIKTLFFDCDNFLFYILTDADSQRDHVLGFFSKEKVSYDDYNLACIVVLPPYQKKGYGMLMIEFSYELSKRAGKVGTPERPLSDLGLRSYLTYWVSTIVRFLRRLLSVLPPETPKVITTMGNMFDPSEALSPSPPSRESEDPTAPPKLKRRKSTKGWDGEYRDPSLRPVEAIDESDPIFSLRTMETTLNPDGSATSHVSIKCTLADIARVTGLRVEDAAFALNEVGLLVRRQENGDDGTGSAGAVGGAGGAAAEEMIVVSREMVEIVAKERNVKRMCMDLAHVLL